MCHLKVDVIIFRPRFPLTDTSTLTSACYASFSREFTCWYVGITFQSSDRSNEFYVMEKRGIIPADGSRSIVIDVGQKGLEGNTRADAEWKASNVTIRCGLFP